MLKRSPEALVLARTLLLGVLLSQEDLSGPHVETDSSFDHSKSFKLLPTGKTTHTLEGKSGSPSSCCRIVAQTTSGQPKSRTAVLRK